MAGSGVRVGKGCGAGVINFSLGSIFVCSVTRAVSSVNTHLVNMKTFRLAGFVTNYNVLEVETKD